MGEFAFPPFLRDRAHGSRRWKVAAEAVDYQLRQPLRPVEVFQAVFAEVGQANVLRKLVFDQVSGDRRDKDLPTMGSGADARRAVDPEAHVALATDARLLVTANPGCLMQVAAALRRRGNGASGDHHQIAMAHTVEVLDASLRNLTVETFRARGSLLAK